MRLYEILQKPIKVPPEKVEEMVKLLSESAALLIRRSRTAS